MAHDKTVDIDTNVPKPDAGNYSHDEIIAFQAGYRRCMRDTPKTATNAYSTTLVVHMEEGVVRR